MNRRMGAMLALATLAFVSWPHPGTKAEDIPMMTLTERFLLPFQEGTPFTITEGWVYSLEEQKIHGIKEHDAVDFGVKEGTPIYAPMSGNAFGGYQFLRKQGYGMGGGFFVEIVAPDGLRFQVCHLQKIAPGIEYSEPIKRNEEWWHPFKVEAGRTIIPLGKPIRTGDLLGWAGHSGLADKDVQETPETAGKVQSWDEDHAHIWAGLRDAKTGAKIKSYDVFGLHSDDLVAYNRALAHPSREDMWARDKGGARIFARTK